MRILIAEDDPCLGELYLRIFGDDVAILVVSPVEAIRTLRSARFDVVISDYDLTGGKGLEIYRWIKENTPETPFLLASGRAHPEIDCAQLKKPFFPRELRHVVNALTA